MENNLIGKKAAVISLGCDKNRVDAEKFVSLLKERGLAITQDVAEAQIAVVNTCAFLESAREEAIDTALEVAGYKSGKLEKLVITGCLPQKYSKELFEELTEADVFCGFKDYDMLFDAINRSYDGGRIDITGVKNSFSRTKRELSTPLHYAYLKIADGCNNKCTYCLIPKIRGGYYSESIENLKAEAAALGKLSELILVAQDTTAYGSDLYGKESLPQLIKELSALDNVESIRLLYCYPERISDALIAEIRDNPKVLKYIDIPFQHADDRILKLMNRKGTRRSYLELIARLKREIPGVALRSTFIAGFPGETEREFENLCSFLREAELHNAGFFAYSREEDTPAYRLPGQIDEKTKTRRVKKLFAVQKKVADKIYGAMAGEVVQVVCDGIDFDKNLFYGRAYFSAPDVDGKVYFNSEKPVVQGEKYDIKIQRYFDYDLYGGRL